MKPRITAAAAAIIARESVHNALRRIENASLAPIATPNDAHERIAEFNASLATEAFFQQPLTDFAVGFRDPALDAELEFFAPEVPVSDRFEYSVIDNAEEFLSDGDDDERAIKGDFKDVEYTEGKVQEKTRNRGLQITLDLDQLRERSNWEEYYVQKLLRRIKRNSLRRAVARRTLAHQIAEALAAHAYLATADLASLDPDQAARRAAIETKGKGPVGVGYLVWIVRQKTRRPDLQLGRDWEAGLAERCTARQLAEIRSTIINRIAATEGVGSTRNRNKSQRGPKSAPARSPHAVLPRPGIDCL